MNTPALPYRPKHDGAGAGRLGLVSVTRWAGAAQ